MDQQATAINVQTKRKYKFLRRSITASGTYKKVLTKVRIKGLYPSKVIHSEDIDGYSIPDNFKEHRYIKPKTMKCLKKVDIKGSSNTHWLHALRTSKGLIKFTIDMGSENIGSQAIYGRIYNTLICLKALSKNIQVAKIYIEALGNEEKHIRQLYRILAAYIQLHTISRGIGSQKKRSYVKEEYRIMKLYIPRFQKLKSFSFNPIRFDREIWEDDQVVTQSDNIAQDIQEFGKLMRNNKTFLWVTKLNLFLDSEMFESYDLVRDTLDEEFSSNEDEDISGEEDKWDDDEEEDVVDDNDDNWEDENEDECEGEGEDEDKDNEEEDINNDDHDEADYTDDEDKLGNLDEDPGDKEKLRIAYEEIEPFFRLHLFENLNTFNIELPYCSTYPLGTFVVKGFEALRKLEVLNMKINCRSPSIVFLYKALLSLPLIQKFSLEAEHLDETQWNLMSKFFNTQNDLVFISFSITVARSTKEDISHKQNSSNKFPNGFITSQDFSI